MIETVNQPYSKSDNLSKALSLNNDSYTKRQTDGS